MKDINCYWRVAVIWLQINMLICRNYVNLLLRRWRRRLAIS